MVTDGLVDHDIIYQNQLVQYVFAFRNSRLSHNLRIEPPLAVGASSRRCLAMQRQSRASGLDEGPIVSGTGYYRLLLGV